MKSLRNQLLLLVSILSPLVSLSQLRYNLNFENVDKKINKPIGWKYGYIRNNDNKETNATANFVIDSHEVKNGKYSLLIDWSNSPEDWTACTYIIDKRFTGKKITLKGYIKTDIQKGFAELWMRMDGNSSADTVKNYPARGSIIRGKTDWKEYNVDLEYRPDSVSKIVFGGLIWGIGKMWIDDLHITIDGTDIEKAR